MKGRPAKPVSKEQLLSSLWDAIPGQLCDEMLDQGFDSTESVLDMARTAGRCSGDRVRDGDIGKVLADTGRPTSAAFVAVGFRRSSKHAPNLPPLALPATPRALAELFPTWFGRSLVG